MVRVEKMPRGLILLNMVFDKIGKGGGGKKPDWHGWRAQFCLRMGNQKDFFFVLLAGNSPVQPLAMSLSIAV